MKKLFSSKLFINFSLFTLFALMFGFFFSGSTQAQGTLGIPLCQQIDVGLLGFKIPSLADILTFMIRIFFVIAGLTALIFMLLGAFAWITSGGDKDSIGAARDKIQAAVIGLIMIVVVLAIMWTLENVVFNRKICMGVSCSVTIPGLIRTEGPGEECECVDRNGKGTGAKIDPSQTSCDPTRPGNTQ